ncbi:hypothetical protein [Plantactinospora soyae]|uniref:PH domain-containing protein n=1 Tax=Plantactinospora soyae TaxID=1544732 RepID=A0A927R652_9ACTN|nr:hypothetical protein [Plantactinospora soyae]MBE1488099.1 hypothetical protein [Plantactinospora soyae]
MLAEFRLTWRQALVRGLRWGGLGSGVVLVIATAVPGERELPELVWIAVLAPLPLGVLCGAATRLRVFTRLDQRGIVSRSFGPRVFVPWHRVDEVRAERRGGRTLVEVYLIDGATLRLRAPYDGGPLDGDPRFEQKLVLFGQLREAHLYGKPQN